MDIDFPVIRKALSRFSGVRRRFEIKGEAKGILVVDDYGHHPTEIRATLQAARQGWNRRIVAVFQPHLYTRTRDFYRDFGRVFLEADVLRVIDIYPAREKPIEGVTGELVSNAAREVGHHEASFCPTPDVITELEKICQEGDMVITFGAGDIGHVANELFERLGGGSNSGIAGGSDWRVPG
jgi:UDP-N-acetylmuramate--alanine ligase